MPTPERSLFSRRLADVDPALSRCLQRELLRQQSQIELIASENMVSRAVLETLGAHITNKTLEGYPGGRFHAGGEEMDIAESLAISRAKQLFNCEFANVQPHSGSQANLAVFYALLAPGDKVLSMKLTAGGHLSHGAKVNLSGQWFDTYHYGVRNTDGRIDYEQMETLARTHRPKLIIAGGSAYPRMIDFRRFRQVADSVDALLMVDMAHIAGLVAGGVHESPLPHADVVTCTTTKTLRGPRGGVILSRDTRFARKLNAAVFPGVQGSVHSQIIAAKAVCFHEALDPAFRHYAQQIVANARTLAGRLAHHGYQIWSEGTDTHLVLMDVAQKGLTGAQAQSHLETLGITTNKNPTPIDPATPNKWTGLRLGTSAGTTRGFDMDTFELIADLIANLLHNPDSPAVRQEVTNQVSAICRAFPIYCD